MTLTVAGAVLLVQPPGTVTASPIPRPETSTAGRSPLPSTDKEPAAEGAGPSEAAAAAPAQAAIVPALPPHGEGAAGDRAVQQALDASWPADLTAQDEHQLLAYGRALLRADATGVGRATWASYFSGPNQAITPSFATARFRVQAAVARRDGDDGLAVVHLVWAGADRGGTYTDGRITDLYFTRSTPAKDGGTTWAPRPRT